MSALLLPTEVEMGEDMGSPRWITAPVRAAKERMARRRAERPERLRRRAEAQAHRTEMKRRHESDPRGGGGGGG